MKPCATSARWRTSLGASKMDINRKLERTPEADEIIAYWGGRTLAGLLLMPPTRHNFLHLSEALRIRQKLR